MDDFDRAQERETQEREALIAARKRFPPPPAAPVQARICKGCGEPICRSRLEVMPDAARCIACEEWQSRLRKLYRGKR